MRPQKEQRQGRQEDDENREDAGGRREDAEGVEDARGQLPRRLHVVELRSIQNLQFDVD